jgi:toxin ParE1/3/4
MARVVIASTADIDTGLILADLAAKSGAATAARYVDRFEKFYHRLTDHPASGPRRPTLGSEIRIGVVVPYIIIYLYDDNADTATVLRIVHGRQDITRRLLAARR